ncbi:MAG: porin family protein [Flavobacteriales bacterium]|nr:PorT family protein [Flavobacteriales bacterium]
MKKVYAILAAVVFSGIASAQTEDGVRLGIKLAPNMAWVRADTKGLESDGNIIGYSFGLMTEFPFGANGNYRFATGINLNNIGGKVSQSYDVVDTSGLTSKILYNSEVRLRYIELPVTVKLMTNEIGYMRYYGQLGLDLAANIRAKSNAETITTTNGVVRTATEEDIDVKESTNVFKAGLVIGGGLEYNFSGGTSALLGVTYHSAFTNLYKKDDVIGIDNAKTFADYIELTLGVFF